MPGSTSVASSPICSPPRTLTAPISVMESVRAEPPVVSRSSTTNVTSRNGVPSSSNDSWAGRRGGRGATARTVTGRQRARSVDASPAATRQSRRVADPGPAREVRGRAGGRPGNLVRCRRRPDLTGAVDWDRLPESVRARLADVACRRAARLRCRPPSPGAAAPVRPVHPGQAGEARRRRADGRAGVVAGVPGRGRRLVGGAPAGRAHHGGRRPADRRGRRRARRRRGGGRGACAAAARRGETGELRAERDAALSRVDKLTVELERLRGELTEARAQARTAGDQRDAEYQQLRRRVSEQGAKLRAALDARDGGGAGRRRAARGPRRARGRAGRAGPGARPGRRRAAPRGPAAAEVAAARQAAREARQADEVRLSLLLDTLGGAVAGLRRELALGGGGPAARRPRRRGAGRPQRRGRRRPGRPRRAARRCRPCTSSSTATTSARPAIPTCRSPTSAPGWWASSPRWPRAPASRSPSCSTGPGVVTAPTRGSRGVRVLFSDPGVLADDVIRALVAAEPQGRPVVVATSDRAVVAVGAQARCLLRVVGRAAGAARCASDRTLGCATTGRLRPRAAARRRCPKLSVGAPSVRGVGTPDRPRSRNDHRL